MIEDLCITDIACRYYNEYDRQKVTRKRFLRLLASYSALWDELLRAEFRPYQRLFTPKQYKIVEEYLGNLS